MMSVIEGFHCICVSFVCVLCSAVMWVFHCSVILVGIITGIVGISIANVMNCGAPPSIPNAFIETPTTTKIAGTVTYICDNGYQIHPGVTIAIVSCMATLNWETIPTCLAVNCGPPPSISNGSPGIPTKTTFGGTVTYTCNSGYRTTMATVSCLDTGNWEAVPTCLAVECGPPPSISNGSPGAATKTTLGVTVTYTCNTGYRTSLGTTVGTASCQPSRNWKNVPTCFAVDCGPPPSISNGSPGTPTKTTFGGTVTYTCNSGYRTTMTTASCLATGNWETVPTCLAVDCGPPPSISNGSPGTPTKTTLGGTVTYTCNSGYMISQGITMATVSCLASRNWETVPICLAICPSLKPLVNGNVTYQPSGTIPLEGTIATHSCRSWATNVGSSERVCHSNGTWSGNPYVCLAIKFTPSKNTPTLGQSFSLTCQLTGADLLNPSISYQWIRNSTNIGHNSDILTFDPLVMSDSGSYWCSVTVSANTLLKRVPFKGSKVFNFVIPTVFFQILIRGINNCLEYIEDKEEEIIHDVTNGLLEGVQGLCRCDLNSNHITKSFLQCFSENRDHVAFRAELSQTSNSSTEELVSFLDQWVRSPGHLTVRGSLLQIDTTCSQVIMDQFMMSECAQSSSRDQSYLSFWLFCSIASAIIIVILAILAIFHVLRKVHGVYLKKCIPAAPCGDNGHKGG